MTPIAPIASVGTAAVAPFAPMPAVATSQGAGGPDFSSLLGKGLEDVQQKLENADNMVRAFALDDSVPIHQVTIALEEARIAVELAMQVRSHLVEAYHQIMNTQL